MRDEKRKYMINKNRKRLPGGVWSAAPTPFNARMELDKDALERMLEHDRRLGINGYFIAGTNGEGPWMRDAQRRQLLEYYVRRVRGRVPLAMQVTDNSAARMLDNIAMARDAGADIAVIAPPYFISNKTPA
ncbi:MAG: dihydrodipicolinate synthase family protein, partial [Clostridia bacterium]|nr:dihydrodipicolinate synthase family protein [Clostridia bacterium]